MMSMNCLVWKIETALCNSSAGVRLNILCSQLMLMSPVGDDVCLMLFSDKIVHLTVERQ